MSPSNSHIIQISIFPIISPRVFSLLLRILLRRKHKQNRKKTTWLALKMTNDVKLCSVVSHIKWISIEFVHGSPYRVITKKSMTRLNLFFLLFVRVTEFDNFYGFEMKFDCYFQFVAQNLQPIRANYELNCKFWIKSTSKKINNPISLAILSSHLAINKWRNVRKHQHSYAKARARPYK